MNAQDSLLVALLTVLGIALSILLIFIGCCCIRRRRQQAEYRRQQDGNLSDDTPLISRLVQPRLERVRAQERSALLTCHFYIRTIGDYTYHSQLSQLGSDPEKNWFLITPTNRKSSISIGTTSHLLTIHPRSDRLNQLNDETSTNNYVRTLNNLFSRLYHPYVEPIVRLDSLYAQKLVFTVKQYQRYGSLKDLLHGVVPTAHFNV
jgi:hypothetical protein